MTVPKISSCIKIYGLIKCLLNSFCVGTIQEHGLQPVRFNLIPISFLPEISLLQCAWKYAEKAEVSLGKISNQQSYSEQNF